MSENIDEPVLGYKIQILTEEAAFIRERHSSSSKGLYRDQLEARYAELGDEIQALKRKNTMPRIDGPRSSAIESGPFGIKFGTPVEELDIDRDDELPPGKYRLSSVPKPHSAFDTFAVLASRNQGVSWIKAIGKSITTNTTGSALQVEFEEMAARLEKVYGPCSDSSDFLQSGSIWTEPLDWMKALQKGERYLSKSWDLKDTMYSDRGLESIYLHASALDWEVGYIGVEYSGTNFEACKAELETEEDDSL